MVDKSRLDELYAAYNRRRWVHPDPIEFLYRYRDGRDREIAALVASSLAYGRVAQILKSVGVVLDVMGPSPLRFLEAATPSSLKEGFQGFKHRFTTGCELAALLEGAKRVVTRYGSLQACFLAGLDEDHEDVLPALSHLAEALASCSDETCNSLLPLPRRGSACKRLNLFLRWLVREDRVDPGGWRRVPPSKLIVPLDTHMHRVAILLGMTKRKNGGLRTAVEITRAFRKIAPDDPVRYDFALTRLGIRKDLDMGEALRGLLS